MFSWGLVVLIITGDRGVNRQDGSRYSHDLFGFLMGKIALMCQGSEYCQQCNRSIIMREAKDFWKSGIVS